MTRVEPIPLRRVGPGEILHPSWCSPDHCQVSEPGKTGKTHESAPVAVGGLTVSVSQSVMDSFTHPVMIIEDDPSDADSGAVMLRLHDVPAFTKALLEFYCRLP
jgi:hypothetical protein